MNVVFQYLEKKLELLVKGFTLLLSPYFYLNIFSSVLSIWQLMVNGGFLITTTGNKQGTKKNISIHTRFQSDGDIITMLPCNIEEEFVKRMCNSHTKRLKQKLNSIWFLPRFLVIVATVTLYFGFIDSNIDFIVNLFK